MEGLRGLVIVVCCVSLLLPAPVWAVGARGETARTVAIIPLHDGSGDVTTDELTQSLATALPQLGAIRVVQAGRVRALSAGDAVTPERPPMADELALAKKEYLAFANRKALAHVETIVREFRAHPDWSMQHGEVLADALLTKALIHHSEHSHGKMTATLQEFVQVAPLLTLDEARYPPSLRESWMQIQQGRRTGPTGVLHVASRPAFAEVRVNGVKIGVTPLADAVLPEGEYQLTVSAPRYQARTEQVRIRANQTERVTARLHWQRGERVAQERAEPREVQDGLRMVDQLKADTAVLVDVDTEPSGAGTITMRPVDRWARASFAPLTVHFDAHRTGLHTRLASMTKQLAALVTEGAAAQSQQLDRIETGSRELLASRKRRVAPWVWAVLGSAVGGGILAGVLLSGGGSSGGAGTGGLVLQLR